MNKIELIQALKDSNNLSKSEAEAVINLFFNEMADALAKEDRVEIRGLCSFFVKRYGGYTGRFQTAGFKENLGIGHEKNRFNCQGIGKHAGYWGC